jgi:hypothetical protein
MMRHGLENFKFGNLYITITFKVLKSAAGGGWRISVGPIVGR